MTSRARAVPPSEAVECRVLAPHLIYDQVERRHVGAGAIVLVHPGAVSGWIRNGWCEIVTDDDGREDDDPADEGTVGANTADESVVKAPTAPRRRAANTSTANGK